MMRAARMEGANGWMIFGKILKQTVGGEVKALGVVCRRVVRDNERFKLRY